MDPLTPDQKRMLEAYISRKQEDIMRDATSRANDKAKDFEDSLYGTPRFRDSGRKASGMGEALDGMLGVPVRKGISELQDGNFSLDALKKTIASIGTDPKNAPTGVDIASRATDNPYLGAGIATAVDLASLPLPGGAMPGAAGKVKKVASSADDILKGITTAEQAVALKGAEREQYLRALDEKFGDRAKRSADMGFGKDTWYHGTTVPVDEFKNEALGLSTGAQSAKKGFFFASDPSTASDYADLAREKGVIREGDNVTTRWLSDKETPVDLAEKELKSLSSDIRLSTPSKLQFGDYNMKTDGITIGNSRYKSIDELEEAIAHNKRRIAESADDPDYIEILMKRIKGLENGKVMLGSKEDQLNQMLSRKKTLEDTISSQGQNVLPVRLRAGEGKIHAKDYKGQGYRDTTYADEMTKAQEKGNSGVLFKRTFDPADPNNRVEQNIAAVFEPNQIRSTNAAFDPRFKDSPLLLAGKANSADARLRALDSYWKEEKEDQ